MLARVTTGSGLRGALAYDLSEAKSGEPRGQWIAGSLIGSPREMARQAGAFRALRPDCKKAILRISLSADPQDGFLTEKKWENIAHDFLKEMAIDPAQHAWCAVRHQDMNKFGDPHDHIHISVVRVSGSGQLWNQEFSAKRAIKASELLEQKHGLQTHAREPPDRRRPQKNESEFQQRTGNKQMPREKITVAIDLVLNQYPDGLEYEEFKQQLEKHGVNLRAAVTQTGRVQGFSFEANQIAFPGSKLGADYGLSGLLQRGVRPPAAAQPKPASTDAPAAAETLRADPAQPTNLAKLRPQQSAPAKLEKEDDEEKAQTGFLMPAPMSMADRQRRAEDYKQQQRAIQARVNSSNCAKSLSQAGLAISHFAMELIARIIEWLKQFLSSKFGVGVQHQIDRAPNGQHKVSLQPVVIDVESRFIETTQDPLLLEHKLDEQLDQAGQAVEQTVKAVTDKDFDNLPGIGSKGRAGLIVELKKAAQLDAASGFAVEASEQLANLETCFVKHKDAAAEAMAANLATLKSPLRKQIESAESTISKLEGEDSSWLKEHPWKVSFGYDAPNVVAVAAEKLNRDKLRAQLKAKIEAAETAAAPTIAALQARRQLALGALQTSFNAFAKTAVKAQDFAKDERFLAASAQVDERTKKLKLVVSTYLFNFQCHIDPAQRVAVLSCIKAVREGLEKWAEIAEPPFLEEPKQLSKDERRERPDDDQNQAPRG